MSPSRCHDHQAAQDVGKALRLIPTSFRDLTACDFVLGVNPIFAGIHGYADDYDGVSYLRWAHTCYPEHQPHRPASDRGPKVVLPAWENYCPGTWNAVRTVCHELGHVLDWRIGRSHIAEPVSEYATTNRSEAFAEAFAAWLWHEHVDDLTSALFRSIEAA